MTETPIRPEPSMMSNNEPDIGTPDIDNRAQEAQKPVAWRHKHWPNDNWHYRESETFGTPYPYYEPLYNQPHKSDAEKMLDSVEQRFPNWESFRDLLDCIDVTLHQFRDNGRSPAAVEPAQGASDWREAMTEIANRAANFSDDDAADWMPSIYKIACEAIGEDPMPILRVTGFDGTWPNRRSPAAPAPGWLQPALDKAAERAGEMPEWMTQSASRTPAELQTEIDRLREAKRRALQIADERAKEVNELRQQVESLKAQIAKLWLKKNE